MTRIQHEDLYQLLYRVADHLVVWHDQCEPHAPGWSWQQSDMSQPIQDLCADAQHAGLICLGRHHPWGSSAFLTQQGTERLETLRAQHIADLKGVHA